MRKRLRPNHGTDMTGGVWEPWLAVEAIPFIAQHLRPDWHGLEFGAGSSTPWYAQRLRMLTTVEHDQRWAARVLREVVGVDPVLAGRIIMLVVPPEVDGEAKYIGSDGRNYQRYVEMPFGEFWQYHFIAIDGRARSACLAWAVDHLRHSTAGMVVLDNSERAEYQDAIALVPASWDRHDFANGEWVTSVWLAGNC